MLNLGTIGRLGAECEAAQLQCQRFLPQFSVFPRLYAMTRKIFCVPATTVGMERLSLFNCWTHFK